MSIRTRIAVSGGAVILVTLFVFNLVILALFNRSQANDRDDTLVAKAKAAAAALSAAPADAFTPRSSLAPIDLRRISGTAETFVEIVTSTGAPILSSGAIDGAAPRFEPIALASAAQGSTLGTITVEGIALRVSTLPWSRPDLGSSGFVVAGQPTALGARQSRGFLVLLVVSSALILGAAFLASWWAAGRALKPLKTIASATDRIGETEDLSQRLPASRRTDEIGRLTTSFNGVLQRIQRSQHHLTDALERQRRFVADASHELRTPLTTIRSNAGFLLARGDVQPHDRDAALRDIAAESERMSRLVDDLLTLARADAGQSLERAPLDLRTLVRDIVRQAQHLNASRDIQLAELGPPDEIVITGNGDALTQLLWILIDNAVKQTHRGGSIDIDLTLANGHAQLAVRDDGAGIPPAELERIFERFMQADRARTSSGSGLGLSIARWIVDQHGGDIVALNNDDRGAAFIVEIPLAPPGSLNS